MKEYYAVVDGVVCYKYYSDGTVPERAIKTDWFKNNDGDSSDIYWAPVLDSEENYACKLLSEYFLNVETGDPDGVYTITYTLSNNFVNKIDTNWR